MYITPYLQIWISLLGRVFLMVGFFFFPFINLNT